MHLDLELPTDKCGLYIEIERQISSLMDPDLPLISNLSNAASLLFFGISSNIKSINWLGFYLVSNNPDWLILGPFQGKVACTKIQVSKGVVGSCVAQQEAIVVPDVSKFKGHIQCDSNTQSEIVIPIFINTSGGKRIVGVLDIDSVGLDSFDSLDRDGLVACISTLSASLEHQWLYY